jgi:hypothetical protein
MIKQMPIARTFRDLSEKEIADIELANSLVRLGWTGGFGWDELLKSPRALIVSEAGVGKRRSLLISSVEAKTVKR